jgi:lipoprotein-releasing system permease protein
VQDFATKAGILKKGTAIQGVVAKGIGPDFDWSFFEKHLVKGTVFRPCAGATSGDILLSRSVADRIQVDAGDSVVMYFIQQPPRARKFRISGIYSTGFEEFDKLYLLCDLQHIRRLNDWKETDIGGTEIYLHDFRDAGRVTEQVYGNIGPELNARSISDIYPQIFDWLQLQDINAVIIITLMILVSGINMISALLVLMLERINLIGTLKSLGSDDGSIRRIFLWVSAYVIGRGLLIGNLAGIGLILVQHFFHPIPLDQASYYISSVPVELNPLKLLMLDAGTLAVSVAMMLLPAMMIGKVRTVSALRFS